MPIPLGRRRGSGLRISVRCRCGAQGRVLVGGGSAWNCPDCGLAWHLGAETEARFAAVVAELGAIRRTALLLPLGTAGAAAILAAALRPSWLIMVPIVLGACVFLYRPTYRRRLHAIYAGLPSADLQPGSAPERTGTATSTAGRAAAEAGGGEERGG
jgi:hypothetical protein